MALVAYEKHGHVAVFTMANGDNSQNLSFATSMLAAYDRAEADRDVRAIVLTSSDAKTWCQGVDLGWLMAARKAGKDDEIRAFMTGMNAVFARGLTFPAPVIAAITGHAFGNGAILACSCDFRFMRSDRGYFCFPEVDISIPFLPGMIAMCRKAIPEQRFAELAFSGRRATAEDLLADHVIEAALPDAPSTLQAAIDYAAAFGKSRAIFGAHKQRFHASILQVMETEDPAYIAPLNLTV